MPLPESSQGPIDESDEIATPLSLIFPSCTESSSFQSDSFLYAHNIYDPLHSTLLSISVPILEFCSLDLLIFPRGQLVNSAYSMLPYSAVFMTGPTVRLLESTVPGMSGSDSFGPP